MLKTIGYVWSGLHTLVGLLLALYYWPRKWRISEGCIEAIPRNTIIGGKWVGAQTHGCVIYYRDEEMRDLKRLRVHERVHVKQGMIGGPFFILAYVGHWLWLWGFGMRMHWQEAYRKIWAERQAYAYDAAYARGEHPDAWGAKENRV